MNFGKTIVCNSLAWYFRRMGVPFLIIDGYNLLHAAGLARIRYAPGDLERLRTRLLGMLAEKLLPVEQLRCTVVFDGQSSPFDGSGEARHRDMRVLFSPATSDADTVIEELIDHHPSPRQTIVVSADHRLHKAARRRGATPMDSEPFWERIRQRDDIRTLSVEDVAPKPKPAKPARSQETAAWLKEFGEFSVDEIAAEVRAEDQTIPGGSPWERTVSDLEQILSDPHRLEGFVDGRDRSARRRP